MKSSSGAARQRAIGAIWSFGRENRSAPEGAWRRSDATDPAETRQPLRFPERPTRRSETCHRSAAGWLRAVHARRAAKRRMPCSGAKPRASIGSARGSQHASEASLCCSGALRAARPTGACGRRDASEASLSRSGAIAPRVKRWGRDRVPEPNAVAVGSARDARMLLRQRPAHAGARALRRSLARGAGASRHGSARAQAKPGAWCGSKPPWERARGRRRPRVMR